MVKICNEIYNNEHIEKKYGEWFPFKLSSFQLWSIDALLNNKHSLITAHTGCGKTVSAEFAIQYYTSIGKKFHELKNKEIMEFKKQNKYNLYNFINSLNIDGNFKKIIKSYFGYMNSEKNVNYEKLKNIFIL